MKIILTTLEGHIFPVEVSPEIELINLKALCEQETNISANEMSLSYNGRPLTEDSKTLAYYSIKDNDIIMVQKLMSSNIPLIDFSSITVPQSRPVSSSRNNSSLASNLANMRQHLLSDPVQFEIIRQRHPELANAIQRNDSADHAVNLAEEIKKRNYEK